VVDKSGTSNSYFHLPPAKKEIALPRADAGKKLQLQLAGNDDWDEF
jgi:methyl-accepting chemotaxis protein